MKLEKCCIRREVSCDNCDLYSLLMRNRLSRIDILQHGICMDAVVNFAQYLYGELLSTPSGKRDADAVKLLKLSGNSLLRLDFMLVFNLCEVAMDSIISRGLKTTIDRNRAFFLLGIYSTFLNEMDSYDINESIYFNAYATYLNAYFQVLHLVKNYDEVIREYRNVRPILTEEIPLTRELNAHFSASAYLSNINNQKVTSRDVAEQLFEIVQRNAENGEKLSAGDYYILAKYLEHYIQENSISKGIEFINPFLDTVVIDPIQSSKEAINRAIFHRDMFEALGKIGSDASLYHYDIAQQIINDYGISDQQTKLLEKKREVETSRIRNYRDVPKTEQTIMVESGGIAVINPFVTGNLDVAKAGYTPEDAERILSTILKAQDQKYDILLDFLTEALLETQGELSLIGEILKEGKSKPKGVLSKLVEFINSSATTSESLSKLYSFFGTILPGAIKKMPEVMELLHNIMP